MSNGSTPSLPEYLNTAINGWLVEMHTAMPGTILSYNAATGLAKVQPGNMRVYTDRPEPVALPVIPGVPVIILGGADNWLRFPIKKGDTCFLHFSERSLERWMENGGQVNPSDSRRFALKDAVAVVGLRHKGAPVRPIGAADSLELAYGRVRLELTKGGKLKLGNDHVELLALLDGIIDHILALTVVGPLPLTPASIAQFTADKVALAKLKV